MATTEKDFRVKNGLIVADNATIGGTLTIGGAAAATESYVTTQIANLIDSAPASLDTLNELAAAINDDANVYTTLTNSIATKLSDLVDDTSPQLGANLDTNNFDIKLKDGDYITLGNSDDVYMWYDPGGNNLNFLKSGGEYRFSGGAVALYYSNQRKLVTDTNGVTVTGDVSATTFTGDGSGLTNLPASGDPAGTGVAMAIALG